MRSRSEFPQVGEVEILRNQKSPFLLRCRPNSIVAAAGKIFVGESVNVMAEIRQCFLQPRWQVFVA
jgi:hypothetical protein